MDGVKLEIASNLLLRHRSGSTTVTCLAGLHSIKHPADKRTVEHRDGFVEPRGNRKSTINRS
jgi:hypothetical protein